MHDVFLQPVVDRILAGRGARPFRVGVDGPTASGKTTIARALVTHLRKRGAPVHLVHMDGFHNPRSIRHRQGPDSIQGYLDDSFNFDAVIRQVLLPLQASPPEPIRSAVYDHHQEIDVEMPPLEVVPGHVIVFEGVFALDRRLREHWDLSLFVYASPARILDRGRARDAGKLGGVDAVEDRYTRRYLPGQAQYRQEQRPDKSAHFLIDTDDPNGPVLRINDGFE